MPVLTPKHRRRALGALVFLLTAGAGVLVGRALSDDSSDATEPPVTTVATGDDIRLVATGAGDIVAVERGDEAAAIDALGLGDDALADGSLNAADLTPEIDRLIPVIEPVLVGGITGDDVDAIADELLGRPIETGDVGAAGGLRPILASGATPALGSIPIDDLDEPGGPADATPATVVTVPVTVQPTPVSSTVDTVPTTSTADTTPPPDDTPPTTVDSAPSDTPPTSATPAPPPSGTIGTIDLPDGVEIPWRGLFDGFPDLFIDPCAGIRPGDPVPEECPPGTGATLLGLGTPPEPFLFWARDHYTEAADTERVCPPDPTPPVGDEVAMTLFSWTPLDEATLRIRPYGSAVAWEPVGTTATADADRIAWNEAFAARELDISWAIMSHCVVIDRDPTVSYELQAVGTDLFGRAVESTIHVLGADDPTLRPPSGGMVLPSGPVARAYAWTVTDGVVRFSHQFVDPDDPGEVACGTGSNEPGLRGSIAAPFPRAIYDPDYTRRVSVDIPMPVAGAVQVCAYIYETDNTVRNPIHVDSMLFRAPAGERPRLVLQGIRRFGDETIDRLEVLAGEYLPGGSIFDPCGGFVRLEDIPPGETLDTESTLFECDTESLFRGDDDGRMALPVTLTRFWDRDFESVELAIEVDVADCATEPCGDRPRQWYEIPIPTRDRVLCGTVFGSGGCDPEDAAAGIAVLRLEYERIGEGGPRDGTVTVLAESDVTEATRFDHLTLGNTSVEVLPWTDPFIRSARVRFDTDRPIQGGLRVEPVLAINPSSCLEDEATIPPTAEFQDRFDIEVSGLCAGHAYDLVVFGVDEEGTEWELDRIAMPSFSVPTVSNQLTANVELLGGPNRLGYLYRLGVQVDGQDLTAYWLELDAPARGSNPSCVALDGTTARSRGFWPPTYFSPDELVVTVYAHVTTLGDDDCSGRSSDLAPIELTGTFTIEQFRDGAPLVVETPADSPIQLRATIEQDGGWTPTR